MDKTIIFIPFRRGSKGIIDKNIKPLKGIPLFEHASYQAFITSQNYINDLKIVIATDYTKEEIKFDEVFDSELFVEFWDRSGKPSTEDSATTESAILEYLEENDTSNYKNMMLIQVTNPMILTGEIEKALLEYTGKGTLFSVVPFNRYLWAEDKTLVGNKNRKRRQDMGNFYLENGAFYIFNIEEFKKSNNRMNNPIKFFEMPKDSLFEIDDEEDFSLIDKLF